MKSNNYLKHFEIIEQWNNTDCFFPRVCIHEQFEKQANISPNHIAVVDETKTITYRELNNRANCLAHYLKANGIKHNNRIAIYIDHSIEAIISMLAVLKTGGVFVPIDTSYPHQRTSYILKDADAKLILTLKVIIRDANFKIPYIDIGSSEIYEKYSASNPRNSLDITDNIYLLYTSGTTGNPKGALLSHLGVSNLLHWYINYCHINPNDKTLIASSLSFDLTYKNIFGSLLIGSQLHLVKLNPFDPYKISEFIRKREITFMNCTPSVFYTIVESSEAISLQSLRQICLGGEPINSGRLNNFITECPNTKITNTYGPTECTDLACVYTLCHDEIIQNKEIPIGKILPNIKVVILNENEQLAAIGEPGELCIGGIGLCHGYLNNLSETHKCFIQNPVHNQLPTTGKKLYKTGDQAKWLENGNIQYLGRTDEQIKLRGIRIEPNEIAKIIVEVTQTKEVIVLCHDFSAENDKRLMAYIVTSNSNINLAALKMKLASQLPDYMLPSHFFYIEKVPLSPNGKLDKTKLHDIGKEIFITTKESKPRNHDEQALLEIWATVLYRPKSEISVDSNFFDLGGYSLLAAQVNARIKRILDVNLPLEALFTHPTIAMLAREIEITRLKKHAQLLPPNISRLNLKKCKLSFSQKRIWFLSKLLPSSGFYNLPLAYSIKNHLNKLALKEALTKLIEHHEIFRTSFHEKNGIPYQLVRNLIDINNYITEIDLQKNELQEALKISKKIINEDANKPFNLETPYLLRAYLFSLSPENIILYLNMHHIILDGWSWNIFKKEISEIYNSINSNNRASLIPPEIQYTDYSEWQNKYHTTEFLSESKAYWYAQLNNIEHRDLPTDFTRPTNPNFYGKKIKQNLHQSIYKNISDCSKSHNITVFTTLISAFILVLYKFSGNHQYSIATPVANRLDEKTENLMGYLINTAIFISRINSELTISEFLIKNKETISQLLTHQHYPFEKLVDDLNIERDITKNPISQIMFSFQNHNVENFLFANTSIEAFDIETHYSRFDIEWQVWSENECLSVEIFYNTEVYHENTIYTLLNQFNHLLEQLPSILNTKLLNLYVDNNKLSISKGMKKIWGNEFIHDHIALHSKTYPEKIGLYFNDEVLNYNEINFYSNKIAHFFSHAGLKKGDRIVLLADKSVDSLIILITCLKLGIIFIPVSLKNPIDRIEFIIHDTSPKFLLTDNKEFYNKFYSIVRTYNINSIREKTSDFSSDNPSINLNDNDPAYIIYTSGSTGNPKGVVVSQKNLCNVILSISEMMKINHNDHWLSISEISFDITLLELFTPLMVGGTLTLIDKSKIENLSLLKDLIESNNFTIIQATPSFWKLLLNFGWNKGSHLRIISGGETLSRSLANQLLNTGAELWNAYGPTETTIWSLLEKVALDTKEIFIGKPIFNTECYVLNNEKLLAPILQKGELYISGEGISLGYWNLPSKGGFLDITLPNGTIKHCYRTGDYVTQTEDGSYIFHGRIDNQIKFNGFRVDISEIELALIEHPYVSQSAVIVKEHGHEKNISAYITLNAFSAENYLVHLHDDWKSVFDNIYHSNDSSKSFAGWINSYNYQQFPKDEMNDWLDHCVGLIKELNPSSILEIGCGLGQLISKLSTSCSKYIALDMSDTAINALNDNKFQSNVFIAKAYAHEAVQYLDESINTVIMNSVVQYFPSIKYLENLLADLIQTLPKNSYIIISDVRCCELAKLFYASLFDHNNKISNDINESVKLIERAINDDRELLINPEYFFSLKCKFPQISHIEIRPKLGKYSNELNKYRFDAIFYIKNEIKPLLDSFTTINGDEEKINEDKIRQLLSTHHNNVLLFSNMVHPFIAQDCQLYSWLAPNNKLHESSSLLPEIFLRIAAEMNVNIKFRISSKTIGAYDAVFYPINSKSPSPIFPYLTSKPANNVTYSYHEPQHHDSIIRHIKKHITTKLPYYMVPSELNVIQGFPLNTSGKIDKKLLEKMANNNTRHAAIHNNTSFSSRQALLANLWSDILSLPFVKESDNFFDLGGHSLLAIELLAKSNQTLGVDVPIYDFYKNPTLLGHWNAILNQHEFMNFENDQAKSAHKPTIFIIPPIDGSASWYQNLIDHLQMTFNCIAFKQSSDITKEGMTVESVAKDYLDKIRLIQPIGPYRIVGWSFGGLIAIELCNQLLNLGETVKDPVLIDTPHPQNSLAISLANKNIELLNTSDKQNTVGIEKFIYHNSLAYIKYQPKPSLLKQALLLRATKDEPTDNSNLKTAWKVIPSIEIIDICNSDHYSIIKSPHVGELAKYIIHVNTLRFI